MVVEAHRHLVDDELDEAQALAASVLERRIITCRVAVPNVLDLRPPAAQTAVGLTDTELCSPVVDYTAAKPSGRLPISSAWPESSRRPRRLGETLALFPPTPRSSIGRP